MSTRRFTCSGSMCSASDGEPDQVGEQHRDDAPLLGLRLHARRGDRTTGRNVPRPGPVDRRRCTASPCERRATSDPGSDDDSAARPLACGRCVHARAPCLAARPPVRRRCAARGDHRGDRADFHLTERAAEYHDPSVWGVLLTLGATVPMAWRRRRAHRRCWPWCSASRWWPRRSTTSARAGRRAHRVVHGRLRCSAVASVAGRGGAVAGAARLRRRGAWCAATRHGRRSSRRR